MEKRIFLFSMEGCPYCVELKEIFDKEKVDYVPIDTETHPKLFDALVEKSGFDHVPQILINDWDGEKFTNGQCISDFDTLEEAFEKVKKILE